MSSQVQLPIDTADIPRGRARTTDICRHWVARFPGAIALADQAIVSITNFAIGVAIGRACGKADLGTYSLALTLLAAADTLSVSLVTTPYMVRSPTLSREAKLSLLGTILVQHFALMIISACFLELGAQLFGYRISSPGASQSLSAAGVALLFVNTREFLRRVSFATLQVTAALLLDLGSCLIQGTGMLVLFKVGHVTVSNVFYVAGGSAAIVSICWLLSQRHDLCFIPRLWLPEIRRSWQSAKWFCLSAVLWNSGTYLYPWLLTTFHGAAAAGTWVACSTIASLGNPVMLGLGNYTAPKIAHVLASSGVIAMRRYIRRSSAVFFALLLPVVLTLAFCGGTIVTRVYGKSYQDTAGVLLLLALTVLISGFSFCYSRGLFCLDSAKADSLINIAAFGSAFIVGGFAVHAYSVFGAALAALVSTAVTCAVRVATVETKVRTCSNSSTS